MKTRAKIPSVLCVSLLWVLWSSTGFAAKKTYEEITVSGGGSISGVVQFKGDIPAPIMQDLSKEKNSDFCSRHPDAKDGVRPIYKVAVNDGKLLNAVVYIENIEKGKAWSKEPIKFDFKDCDIFPRVSIVRKTPKRQKTGLLAIENHDDDVLHNPHGYNVRGAQRITFFNKPLPSKGSTADVTKNMKRLKQKKDGHFFLQCDQHNFMEADAKIVWNPYYSITGKDGSFKLDQVPAGKYKVTVWHPYAGTTTRKVSVRAGVDAKMDFALMK